MVVEEMWAAKLSLRHHVVLDHDAGAGATDGTGGVKVGVEHGLVFVFRVCVVTKITWVVVPGFDGFVVV